MIQWDRAREGVFAQTVYNSIPRLRITGGARHGSENHCRRTSDGDKYTRTLVTSITSSVDSMTFSIAEAAAFVTPPLIGPTPLSRDGAHLPVFVCKDYVSADVTGWRSAGTGVHRLACVRAGHVTGRQGGWRRWHGDGDGRGRRRQKRRYVRPLTFRRGSTLTLTRTMTDLDPA